MKISRTKAFTALNNAHQKANASKQNFAVKSLNKNGSISKMAPIAVFETEEAAENKRMMMEKLNPGSKFVVVSL